MPRQITITTGARLHCGLFAPGEGPGRRFGGVGVMVKSPALVLQVSAADRDSILAPAEWVSRIESLLARCRDQERSAARFPVQVNLQQALPAHAGFGSGTQLALSLTAALTLLAGETLPPAAELARRAGRGKRSAVGSYGFEQGGLIVEGGKTLGSEVSPLVARIAVPSAWRFVLIRPPDTKGLFGADELQGFVTLAPMPSATTDRLCRLTLLELLPAVTDASFDEAAAAFYELGRTVGEYFAPVQGGVFADRRMAALALLLRDRGWTGVGQTSWGPTLFVLTPDARAASELVAELSRDDQWRDCLFQVAEPLNRGAEMQF